MTDVRDQIAGGYYARQQIHCGDPLIAWSHRRRFRRALVLARAFAGARVLDYGCGDGTFLGLLQTSDTPPARAVGAEIDPRIVNDCQRRFASIPGLGFVNAAALERPDQDGAYDSIFCMEVLEHVVDPARVLSSLRRLLRPGGTLVISVPVETGLPVVVKQLVRRLAGWRRIGHYPGTSTYSAREMLKSIFASSVPHVDRPVFRRDDGQVFHDHKGFNWRVVRAALAARFDLVSTSTSPFNWTGPHLGTQVWFVARRAKRGPG
jgi:SAM-dependent methyltransferase